MKPEMSNAEAITRIDRFLAYLEEIWTPQCDYEEALIRRDDVTAFVIARDALKEQRPQGTWIEIKDEDGITYCGCSNCSYVNEHWLTHWVACPNCGASMKKESDGK